MTDNRLKFLVSRLRAFARARKGNVAMMFGVALVPVMIAAGAGLDMARAMMARTAMSQALDAAALAVGSTPNVSQAEAQAIAQKYFNQNYKGDPSYGPQPVLDPPNLHGQQVTLTATQQVNTTLLAVGGFPYMNIGASSTVVWGQTKLWVALALDNTGSMSQTDSTGTSKMSALKTALNGTTVNNVHTPGLLDVLRAAATEVGDVQVTMVPFSKDVNVGTANVDASWISWTDWESQPPNVTLTSAADNNGPGSACPFTNSSNRLKSPYGFYCVSNASNGSSTRSTIPSSGLICPGADSGTYNTTRRNRYYNGCYNSTPTQTLITTTDTATPTKKTVQGCSQTGSGSISCNTNSTSTSNLGSPIVNTSTQTVAGYSGDSTNTTQKAPSSTTNDGSKNCNWSGTCTWTRTIMDYKNATTVVKTAAGPWNHAWIVNSHSTWEGCIMDRNQDYDTNPDTPSSANGSLFPAENAESCPPSAITPLPATWDNTQWTSLASKVTAMQPNGSTNQTIGLAHAMQTLLEHNPYNAPELPAYTTRYIILLSDGLNTQNRWNGDGSNQSTAVDGRMAMACAKAKALGFVVYTIYVDLAGTQGNSSVLQSCASDPGKYFPLTSSGAIVTAFNTIGQQITALHVSQ
jgi:Flp pilus assembly protein TadG